MTPAELARKLDARAQRKCEIIGCVCKEAGEHEPECRYRISLLCPVGIECEHGFDVCLICDPCTCKEPK